MEHQDDIFVGYNSTHYDAIVAKGLLNNMCPSFVTEQIIEKGKTEYQILKNKPNHSQKEEIWLLSDHQMPSAFIAEGIFIPFPTGLG